jgi:hypothetical protein
MYKIQQITLAGKKKAFKAKSMPAISGYFGI